MFHITRHQLKTILAVNYTPLNLCTSKNVLCTFLHKCCYINKVTCKI